MTATVNSLSRQVFINGALRPDARVLEIRRLRDRMQQIARIEFFLTTGATSGRLHNTSIRSLLPNSICEIKTTIGGLSYTYHVGRIAGGGAGFDPNSDMLEAESRLDEHLFGQASGLFSYAHRPDEDFTDLENWRRAAEDYPLVFNPIVDGRRQGNRFLKSSIGDDSLIHPDSVPRYDDSGTDYNIFWTLRSAARFLCEQLNFAETYVANPSGSDWDVLPDYADQLTNLSIPRGTYLPSALERLLREQGYGAYIEMPNANNAASKPFIRFMKRNNGPRIRIKGQAKGAILDLNNNQAFQCKIGYDMVNNSAKQIVVRGARPVLESTFELVPGWPQELDSESNFSNLMLDSEWARVTPGGERAWRNWVLNENNDYQSIRDNLSPWNPEVYFDDEFRTYFTNTIRRPFRPTLSQYENEELTGIHNGVFVQFSLDDGENWYSITGEDDENGTSRRGLSSPSCRVLKKEAGIRFSGTYPPRELIATGLNSEGRPRAKIRVTACLEADQHIIGFAEDTTHPIVDPTTMTIDASGKYRLDRIQSKSIFKGYLELDTGFRSGEIDDRDAVSILASEVRETWGHPQQNGSITLFGAGGILIPVSPSGVADVSECLGFSVEKISGRELSFGLNSSSSRFPTIEAIVHDFIRNETRLDFKTYRGAIR